MGFKDRKNALEDVLDNNIEFTKRNNDNIISERNIYKNYLVNSLKFKMR